MSVYGLMNNRAGTIVDPWDYQEPASNPPGPCRSIPITDEIRAADAEQRAAREHPVSGWKIREELRLNNLRKSRPKVIAKPKSTTVRPHRAPKPTPATAERLSNRRAKEFYDVSEQSIRSRRHRVGIGPGSESFRGV